jgi:CRP/FNR family cyclic AMP-dependent transcriptional regulator
VDVKQLEGVGLFSSLSKGELEKLSRWTDDLTVREGEELATEGRFAHEFFMIEEGTAKVLKGGEEIAELGPGDFFGEIAMLGGGRRSASVTTTSRARLLVMSAGEFRRLQEAHPAIAAQVEEAMRQRLAT